MAKFSWSEVFMSIEGEGPHSGWPTVYIRFTGCNFQCKGFNNPEMLDTTSEEVLGFNPTDYKNIYDIPLITKGCDSIYSWDNKFRHMWTEGDENELAKVVMDTIPHHSWTHPVTGQPVILSLTGGEPTLRAKHLPALLNHPLFDELKYILVETNGSVPFTDKFIIDLNKWIRKDRKIIWSNSPKLSISGEDWDKAIRPDVIELQTHTDIFTPHNFEQYFKFVCGPTVEDFDEVEKAMNAYYDSGSIQRYARVYIMPVACLEEQQQEIASKVAQMCIERGYIYCHRIQNSVFGNGVGT